MNAKNFSHLTATLRSMCSETPNTNPPRFSYQGLDFSVARLTSGYLSWVDIEMDVLALNDENFGSAVANAMHINHQVFVASPAPVFFAVRDHEEQLQLVLHQRIYGEHVEVTELFAQLQALKEQLLEAHQAHF
jgi:hypothetical protein